MSLDPPPLRPLALLTGADAPFGAAIARELAARGVDLLLVGDDGAALWELRALTVDAHGVHATLFQGDLSRESPRRDLAELVAAAELKPDFLVHAAPLVLPPSNERGAERRQLDVCERATLDLVELVRPGFQREDNGYLLLLADESGLGVDPDHPAAAAAARWLVGYGLSLAEAWKGSGVSATVACRIATEDPDRFASRALKALFARQPLLKPARPSLARAVARGIRAG